MKALVDTCIVIDALQSRIPFYEDAQSIFLAVANNQFVGYLTAKSVTDIYYLTHKCTHSDQDTRRILNTLLHLFDLIDTSGLDCRRALSSEIPDFEDAVMIESAIRAGADCMVTRNLKDYKKAPIPIYAPADFLNLLRAEQEPDTLT